MLPVRALATLVLLAGAAAAQPVSYALKGQVPKGEKPQLRITAATGVSDVRIELDRDDGKHFSLKQGKLAKAQVVTLNIGDGAPGKASYKGTISAQAQGDAKRWQDDLAFDTMVMAPIKVGYDVEHLDLDKHVLQFTMSSPAGSAELVAIGEDGSELGKGSATYGKDAPGTWLAVSWTQPATARVMMLKLRAVAADGGAVNVELVPWSVTVDHEDVTFATDSAKIEPSEEKKLDESLVKIQDIVKTSQKFLKLQLYLAGHTDTVGPNAKNRKLSLDRALAIASYFRSKGLAISIAYAGFGEEVLKVKTADNTDERQNRRVDYILALEPPRLPQGSTSYAWKGL